jgi:uncharacterized protein
MELFHEPCRLWDVRGIRARSGQINFNKVEGNMLKRAVLVAVTIALVVPIGLSAVWLWGQAAPAAAQTSQPEANYSPAQTITVVGQGSVRIKPDIAQISIGVETSAESVTQAVEDNKTQMESIMAALSEAGIADKDIQTMNYSIQFDRYPQPMPATVEGENGTPNPQYRVSNMVNVTVRKLDSVSTVLDAVVQAGANNIWGVSFSLEDQKPAQSDARANAITDAKERAQALADLNGVTLGPVMSVSEVLGGGSVPVPMAVVKESAAGAGPISPGELEISYQVQVSYFIEP